MCPPHWLSTQNSGGGPITAMENSTQALLDGLPTVFHNHQTHHSDSTAMSCMVRVAFILLGHTTVFHSRWEEVKTKLRRYN